MENVSTVRKIDELGRIVLPITVRKELGWDVRDSLLITHNAEEGTATLRLHEKAGELRCSICKANEPKVNLNGVGICGDCLERIKEM